MLNRRGCTGMLVQVSSQDFYFIWTIWSLLGIGGGVGLAPRPPPNLVALITLLGSMVRFINTPSVCLLLSQMRGLGLLPTFSTPSL